MPMGRLVSTGDWTAVLACNELVLLEVMSLARLASA